MLTDLPSAKRLKQSTRDFSPSTSSRTIDAPLSDSDEGRTLLEVDTANDVMELGLRQQPSARHPSEGGSETSSSSHHQQGGEYDALKSQSHNDLRRAVAAFTYSFSRKEFSGFAGKGTYPMHLDDAFLASPKSTPRIG